MAFISKNEVQQKAAALKPVFAKYGIKATVSGSNSSTVTVKIKSGRLDFMNNAADVMQARPYAKYAWEQIAAQREAKYTNVNTYYHHDHYSGECLAFLKECMEILNAGNHDNSDIMTDYFDVGWYVNIKIGQWDNPYVLVK